MGGRRSCFPLAEELQRFIGRHVEHLAYILPAQLVLEHLRLEPLPLAVLASRHHTRHHRQIGIDYAVAVARGASSLGVGAEQGRLHSVRAGKCFANGIEQARVCRRVAAPGAADRALVNGNDAFASRNRAVDQRTLPRSRHARDDHQHA